MTANPDRISHPFEVIHSRLPGNYSPSNTNPKGTHTITSPSPHSLPTPAPSTFITSGEFLNSDLHSFTHSVNASTNTLSSFRATITSLSKPLATPTTGNQNSSGPPPNIMGAQYYQPGSAGIVIACVMGVLGIFFTILTVIHCLQVRAGKREAKRIKDYNSEFDFSEKFSDNESDRMFLTLTTRSQSTISLKNQSHSRFHIESNPIQT
ncbi:uncharacterized protein MELLADRAFT_61051 [Melampsora larici-populina 98AG31]|uniref:Uncharacterized protein n=1 Tax=Melampsora larici-populina (strain 98AG31 / pathotype 3-4-7) TaxID=747676 RepID=F4RDE3_MELLP|nr:uncharacterized protein MELLADRAFT_61051 [Melampsora larici-populina 98AG31]EGG09625.1 hypothetical protein MELLADRAFT_61051 [Melampsora larici-populina 98AG31]